MRTFIKNPADTWVARLETKLQTISNKRVQVINAGINYGTSAAALAGYVFRHRFLQPDIVIYHGGETMSCHYFVRTIIPSTRTSEARAAALSRDRERNAS